MSFMLEQLSVSIEYSGLAEISGPKDHPMIEVGHQLCKIESYGSQSPYSDEIPWCSVWQVIMNILTNIRRNPKGAYNVLARRNVPAAIIKQLFMWAKVPFVTPEQLIDTGVEFVQPTWSADSTSWDIWGTAITPANAKRGDLLRFTRKGGGHITQLNADKLGIIFVDCFGGNQGNKVCSSSTYLKSNLISIRRANVDVSQIIYGPDHELPPGSDVRYPTIRFSSGGPAVLKAQHALNLYLPMVFKINEDGYFDRITEKATKEFQAHHGLANDGIIGPKTWKELLK